MPGLMSEVPKRSEGFSASVMRAGLAYTAEASLYCPIVAPPMATPRELVS